MLPGAPLPTQTLRFLSLDAHEHPRGQTHVSSASGLVCQHGRAYVIADDEHHLAVFNDLHAAGRLHRIVDGDLPAGKKARKRAKPDMETLLHWPTADGCGALLALGSGSRQGRDRAAWLALDADGEPTTAVRLIDLAPLYEPLRALLGSLNIEGAFASAGSLVLINRGLADGSGNTSLHYRDADVQAWLDGRTKPLPPRAVQHHALPHIRGVSLAFSDAAALPAGDGWLFTAVAEDTEDSVADGEFVGAAVGRVDAQGAVVALRPLSTAAKIEGIDLHHTADGLQLCLVTDADDPQQPSQLLRCFW